jgi:hypothetical protein
MASTYSDLKIELIGTGEQVGTWGATTNTNLGTAIEDAITGSANVSFSSADITLTLTNTNGAQTARNLRLVCTGTSGGARNLILGSGCQINKLYLVQNDLADAVTVKNTTGTGVSIPAGGKKFVFNDGTNVIEATTGDIVNLATGVTGTLPIANGGTGATTNTQARTNLGLGTISTQAANNVAITGGSITGITDLAVADGGTGASNAAGARTNLGLVIGTDVPGPTGTGASGTWGINITGNASGNAGTVTNGVYTTNFTGANQSLGTSGWQKLPGGLMIQWGNFSSNTDAAQTVNLPTSFSGTLYSISVSGVWGFVTSIGSSSFVFDRSNDIDTTVTAYYIALGPA